jgi:hypothetical protein
MRKKYLLTPITIIAMLPLASGPAFADEPSDDATTEECPAPTTADTAITLEEAAQQAADAATDLVVDDECDSDRSARASEALQAALDRLSVDGNGVAALVLQALLDGESPAGIGAEHGAAMAQAAQDRNAERAAARAAGQDAADVETPETPDPAVTPAQPATPAVPGTDDTPTEPAIPATPAQPETSGRPETPGRPANPGRP